MKESVVKRYFDYLRELYSLSADGNEFNITSLHAKHRIDTNCTKILIKNKIIEKNVVGRSRFSYKWKTIPPNIQMAKKLTDELDLIRMKIRSRVEKKVAATEELKPEVFPVDNELYNVADKLARMGVQPSTLRLVFRDVSDKLYDSFVERLESEL